MLTELEVSLDVIYELSKVLDLQKLEAELALRTNPWISTQAVSNGNGSFIGQNSEKTNTAPKGDMI